MHNEDLFKVRIVCAIEGLIQNFALDLEVSPKQSTIESFAESFYNDGFKFEHIRDGLALERDNLLDTYKRTGQRSKHIPKYEVLKKAIELHIGIEKKKNEEIDREKKTQDEEFKKKRAIATFDRAIEKFGFDEVQQYILEYMKVIHASGFFDVSTVEYLRKVATQNLKGTMLELFDAKGDMNSALINAAKKFEEEQGA